MKTVLLRKLNFSKTGKSIIVAGLIGSVVLLSGCQDAGGMAAEQNEATRVSAAQTETETDAGAEVGVTEANQETTEVEETAVEETEGETATAMTGEEKAETKTTEEEMADTSFDEVSEEALEIINQPAGTVLTQEDVEDIGEDAFFTVSEIDDELFARMYGKSFKEDCTVPREDLRYIRCLHKDAEGRILIGEMVVNRRIAEDIREIFHELYQASFPIEKMHLVDDYNASDDWSMEENNTSSFNYRVIAGTDTISNHAYGLAIDINPYYNVYYIPSSDYVSPASAYEYKNRDMDFPYKVEPGDLCYELFMEHGFSWGGWWDYAKDYQHFEKPLSEFDE